VLPTSPSLSETSSQSHRCTFLDDSLKAAYSIQNIEIGNITVIVSVPLPGASPVSAFSAYVSDSTAHCSAARLKRFSDPR
jgi:hypothetical protein